MIVVATDAPIDARDLKRLAARAVFGLARTGSSYSNGSGEFAIAFSTAPDCGRDLGSTAVQPRTLLPTDGVSPLFQAALEATEEAVYNSLLKATARHEPLRQGRGPAGRAGAGNRGALLKGAVIAP
jgi:D-aminopeptidase